MAYFGRFLGYYEGFYFGGFDSGPPPPDPTPIPVPPAGLAVARVARFRALAPARIDVPKVRRHNDRPLDLSVREARSAIKELGNTRIPFGAPVEVTFTAANTPVRVTHGLPTQPTGYIVIRKSTDLQVYDSPSAVATDTTALTLAATKAGTVTLWIF